MSIRPTYHQADEARETTDWSLLVRLLGYLKPYRGRAALGVLLLFSVSLLELVGPWLTMVAIDQAIPDQDAGFLLVLVLAFVTALVLSLFLEYAQAIVTTWLGQRVMYDLRREVFEHLQKLSLRYFDRNPVGRLMTRLTNDVEALNELFSSGVVTVFGDLFTLLFIIGAMLYIDPVLALVAFSVLPFALVVAFLFRLLVRRAYQEIRVRLARINAYLQESIGGMQVLQLFGRQGSALHRFERVNRDHLDSHLRSITYYAAFFPIIELLSAVAFALILWHGGGAVIQDATTVGVIAAFLQYARRFFRPIQDLSEKYNLLQAAMAASERVFDVLDTRPRIEDPTHPRALPSPARGEIEFRDVWFRYEEDEDWVLKGVSLRVLPGERIAIVGATGAGKSTIINLLMRFYDPQRGDILFDGVPIREVASRELRDRIGLVLQDVFLFSRDVRSNIRLGDRRISEERVRASAERVGAARVIEQLPQGYDQSLGERGVSLSVGERQLVSFARALAFDPAVLVLDEATSSVDSELEARIEAALATLMRSRSTLVIAHRLSTIVGADEILVLHRGEIRERGRHEDLLRQEGIYARLYELQFAEEGAGDGGPATPGTVGRNG